MEGFFISREVLILTANFKNRKTFSREGSSGSYSLGANLKVRLPESGLLFMLPTSKSSYSKSNLQEGQQIMPDVLIESFRTFTALDIVKNHLFKN